MLKKINIALRNSSLAVIKHTLKTENTTFPKETPQEIDFLKTPHIGCAMATSQKLN